MALGLAAALTLVAQCAPTVAPETLLPLVQVESRFNPLAIGVNSAPRINVIPSSVDDAVAKATALIDVGRNIDLGLAQINSRNLGWLGLSLEQAFDPCTNLAAAARILQDGYARGDPPHVGEQAALRTALSLYNTGHPLHGFTNGYVDKVTTAAIRLVPALSVASRVHRAEPAPVTAPSPAAWDVFGEVRPRPNSFVMTVSIPVSGGSQ
jgi:type IV secretion system protein VirB1